MDLIRGASPTPDLQQSQFMSGGSDDDSAHATPSDMTLAAQSSPHELWWPNSKVRTEHPIRSEEEVRKIHYIDSPVQENATPPAVFSAATGLRNTTAMLSSAVTPLSSTADSAGGMSSVSPRTASTATAQLAISSDASAVAPSATGVFPTNSVAYSTPDAANARTSTASSSNQVAETSGDVATERTTAESGSNTADPLPLRLASTAPSSAASTPSSTPGPTPQTYARKRGRPRKHPLRDANNAAPLKSKRKLSADSASAAAKKKIAATAAARSAASNAGSLLSVPDLGRLIPQGSSSENAQNFIQNNLRLFADLFVALQKQATTDHSTAGEASATLTGTADASVEQASSKDQHPSSAAGVGPKATSVSMLKSCETSSTTAFASPTSPHDGIGASMMSTVAARPSVSSTPTTSAASNSLGPTYTVSSLSDPIRDEIKRKLTDVTKGRQAIQAEMLQMKVDASFFENAQKTVDERIAVLRERIAKHTALLKREREATRKVREASRKAKKDRKAREKSLKDSESEERRLAQTFMQLEREIAAEEEERRRLEEIDSADDEYEHARDDAQGFSAADKSTRTASEPLQGADMSILAVTPSEATFMSATASPSATTDTPGAADRAIGFSDEELAKVLGISTSELAGFSQTLELPSLHPAAASVVGPDADATTLALATSSYEPILEAETDRPNEHIETGASGTATEGFDVAAFLELASSFGAVAPGDASNAQQQQIDNTSPQT